MIFLLSFIILGCKLFPINHATLHAQARVHYEGKCCISYQRIQAYLESQSTSVSCSGTTQTSFLYFTSYSTSDAEITSFYLFKIKTWKKLITHTHTNLSKYCNEIPAYIYYLKMQLLLCQLPLLKLLDTGGGLFSFLQFSENTAYILPSYLLHTDDTSVYICLLGMADFLVLSSAPKPNAKAKSNQYKSLWLIY